MDKHVHFKTLLFLKDTLRYLKCTCFKVETTILKILNKGNTKLQNIK